MNPVIVNESSVRVPRKFLHSWLAGIQKELQRRKILSRADSAKDLTLVFLDRKPARKLNHQFRGKDYATDVLSFAALEPSSFGELVMCPEVLKKQAQEHGLTYQQELGYMVLHGVLHLLGYDHELGEKQAREMFALQDAIFEGLLKKISASERL